MKFRLFEEVQLVQQYLKYRDSGFVGADKSNRGYNRHYCTEYVEIAVAVLFGKNKMRQISNYTGLNTALIYHRIHNPSGAAYHNPDQKVWLVQAAGRNNYVPTQFGLDHKDDAVINFVSNRIEISLLKDKTALMATLAENSSQILRDAVAHILEEEKTQQSGRFEWVENCLELLRHQLDRLRDYHTDFEERHKNICHVPDGLYANGKISLERRDMLNAAIKAFASKLPKGTTEKQIDDVFEALGNSASSRSRTIEMREQVLKNIKPFLEYRKEHAAEYRELVAQAKLALAQGKLKKE